MDTEAKKKALRAINYGLYVLGARHDGEIGAAAINWVTQASFDPPLVVVALRDDSRTREIVSESGKFAVSVLAEDQLDIGKDFFRSTDADGTSVNGHPFEDGPVTGSPILTELPYWFECEVRSSHDDGDHTIFIATVVNAGVRDEEATPLLLRSTGMNYGG